MHIDMSRLTILLLTTLPALSIAQQHTPMVEDFFLALKNTVSRQDTATLKQLVYPFKDDVEDMQEGLIELMLKGDPQQRGDGAFSSYALDTLIAHHLSEIKPIADELYAQLSGDRFFGTVISSYKQKHVWVMDFHEVRMILLEKDGKLQLLFWENLNRLLNPALRQQ